MRTHRLVVAGLLVAAGIGMDAVPGYAANDSKLTVSPGHGSPDAEFTATYEYPRAKAAKGDCGAPTTFQWDGSVLGSARPGPPTGNSCVATLTTTPPAGSARRAHFISATNGSGKPAIATYTITAPPAPAPSSGATTPGAPAPAPAASTTTGAAASPAVTASASPTAAAAPQVTDQSLPSTESGVTGPAEVAGQEASAKGGGFPTGWLIALGAVLLLCGAAVFAAIMRQSRRGVVADADGVDPAIGIVSLDTLLLPPVGAVTQQLPAVVPTGTAEGSPGPDRPQPPATPPTQRAPQDTTLAQPRPQVG
jgi:hypothetical protein